MNSVRSNNPSLKYQRFTPSGCKDIEMRKLEIVTNDLFSDKNIIFTLTMGLRGTGINFLYLIF